MQPEGHSGGRGTLLAHQVLNTSVELLPLWLLGGPYAYSLEAACPLGKTQGCLDALDPLHLIFLTPLPQPHLSLEKLGRKGACSCCESMGLQSWD